MRHRLSIVIVRIYRDKLQVSHRLRKEFQFAHPFVIFPRKNMKADLLCGTLPGAMAVTLLVPPRHSNCTVVQTCHFYWWPRHLNPNHEPQRYWDKWQNGTAIICLLPQWIRKLQPHDATFKKSFETYYAQELEKWLKAPHGHVFKHH